MENRLRSRTIMFLILSQIFMMFGRKEKFFYGNTILNLKVMVFKNENDGNMGNIKFF